jgi:CheY-like chemotaxis protein
MRILLVEANPVLRRCFADELEEAGYLTVGVGTWIEAHLAAREERPGLILVNATLRPDEAARFVRELRSDRDLGNIPVAGIALVPGAERGILEAGAQFCIRDVPTRFELVKAARWAASVYCEVAA